MSVNFRIEDFFSSRSRRSPVLSTRGIVASSQPLATQAGIEILLKGGNAADAAVACAAALNVTEPMSTGIGGDCFALFYDSTTGQVKGINGSGRAPRNLSINVIIEEGITGSRLPATSPHAITVPGAVAGWVDTVQEFGNLGMEEILLPAIRMARDGHPVSPLVALAWIGGVGKLRKMPNGTELLINGAPPEPGQLFKNEHLARVFERIATRGKDGFYKGEIASKIAHVVQDLGGKLTMEDLSAHQSSFVDPVSISYRGFDVHEIPPNGQGITALLALNILNGFDLAGMDPSSHEYIHLLVESLRIAFADAGWFVADPDFHDIPLGPLLSDEYAAERRALIDQGKANLDIHHGEPAGGSDTVYLSVVDGKGNACSFINSNYMAFGTGIIPENCGFVLQNRGCNFSLEPGHPNRLEPKKRPYHTIIPAMSTLDGELHACFGVMGGFMQPQGHVQVFSRLVDQGQDPQAALDAPRFCIEGGNPSGVLLLEESVSTKTAVALKTMGHEMRMVSGMERSVFGRGQIITRDPGTGVMWGGSDPRSDGCAIGL